MDHLKLLRRVIRGCLLQRLLFHSHYEVSLSLLITGFLPASYSLLYYSLIFSCFLSSSLEIVIIWFHSSLLSSNTRFSLYPLVFLSFSPKPFFSLVVHHKQLSFPATSCSFSLPLVHRVHQLSLSS